MSKRIRPLFPGSGQVAVVNLEHEGGEAGVVNGAGGVVITRRLGPRAVLILVFKKGIAEHRVVFFPGKTAFIDHGLRGVVVLIVVDRFLEVEGRVF